MIQFKKCVEQNNNNNNNDDNNDNNDNNNDDDDNDNDSDSDSNSNSNSDSDSDSDNDNNNNNDNDNNGPNWHSFYVGDDLMVSRYTAYHNASRRAAFNTGQMHSLQKQYAVFGLFTWLTHKIISTSWWF